MLGYETSTPNGVAAPRGAVSWGFVATACDHLPGRAIALRTKGQPDSLVDTLGLEMPGADMPDFELPGWAIEIDERSPGVWRFRARHASGPTFETADSNLDRAFQRLKDYDADLRETGPSDVTNA